MATKKMKYVEPTSYFPKSVQKIFDEKPAKKSTKKTTKKK